MITEEEWWLRPHHHIHDGRPPNRMVFLNGESIDGVIEANTQQGWIRVHVYGANPEVPLIQGDEFVTKTIRGDVRVEFMKDGENT